MSYGYREIESPRVVTTRKPHRCEWCDERIEVGTRVPYRKYVYDGELRNGWMHPECFDAMQEVDPIDLQEGWMPGDYARGSTTDEKIRALPIDGD